MPERRARIRAVLFDAAGTLLRTREPVGETYARSARAFGVDLPPGRLQEAFERVLEQAPPNVHPGATPAHAATLEREWWRERVRQTFRAADATARFSDFEGYFDALWRHYAEAAAWRLAPGAVQALRALRARGRALAVLSNFDQRLHKLLKDLGIRASFDAVTLPADAGAAKPDRRIFEVCLQRLGRTASEAVYIGDRAEEDLRAARMAGLRAIDAASLATLVDLPARIDALERLAPNGDREQAAPLKTRGNEE